MSRRWFQQGERGSPLLVRFILWLALHVGRAPARLLLYPISGYFLLTGRAARRASRRFLGRALGRPAGWLDAWRHIHCFAAVILDRVFFLADRNGGFDVRLHGFEEVADDLERGGCLLFGSHLGSFEALRTHAVRRRFPLKVLMYRDHNATVTGLLDTLNPAVADTVIPLGRADTLLQVREALEEGCLVGLLADRVAESDKTVHLPFLGRAAAFPTGPMYLAATLQAPVILFFGIYRGGRRYDIHFETLGSPGPVARPDREAAVREWTGRYVARLEAYARDAPFNWFNFYDFWDEEHAG